MLGEKLSVLVVGAGMYVCGKGTPGCGTILPTLIAQKKKNQIGEIFIVATSEESLRHLQEKAKQVAALFDTKVAIQGFTSYQKAASHVKGPACAIISVPDSLHFNISKDLLSAGFHLLVVKPLTATAGEAETLIRLAQKKSLYGAVEFHKRFDEANLLLKHHFQSGNLGELRQVLVAFSQRRNIQNIFRKWIKNTNVFQYLGVHYADLIHFISGARPRKIAALGMPSTGKDFEAIEALIEWEIPNTQQTFSSSIATHWIDPNTTTAMSDQKITMIGTKGRFESDQKNRGVQLVTELGGVERINPYFSQIYRSATGEMEIEGYGPKSIRQFLKDVLDLIHGDISLELLQTTRPSFKSAYVSTVVIEGVNKSLEKGGTWIEF